eukprot:6179041-Pleurochrysis_carterae.AAC.5
MESSNVCMLDGAGSTAKRRRSSNILFTSHVPPRTCAQFFAYGYKSHFAPSVGSFGSVYLPFEQFTDFWDDATGEPIHTCAENAAYCPDDKTKQNMKTMSIWAEGVEVTRLLKDAHCTRRLCDGRMRLGPHSTCQTHAKPRLQCIQPSPRHRDRLSGADGVHRRSTEGSKTRGVEATLTMPFGARRERLASRSTRSRATAARPSRAFRLGCLSRFSSIRLIIDRLN